jgi:hypothetical protein
MDGVGLLAKLVEELNQGVCGSSSIQGISFPGGRVRSVGAPRRGGSAGKNRVRRREFWPLQGLIWLPYQLRKAPECALKKPCSLTIKTEKHSRHIAPLRC